MDLDARLRAFAAFVRRRTFSGAARELNISQPAVSKHIADIERDLQTKLVHRRPRAGTLTAAGEFLATHVLRAQALLAPGARARDCQTSIPPITSAATRPKIATPRPRPLRDR